MANSLFDIPGPGQVNPMMAMANPDWLNYQIAMSEYQDWQNIFKPLEMKALNQLSFMNPEVLPKAVNEAETAAAGQSQAMSGILERSNKAAGIAPTAQETQSTRRMMNLDQALNVAGAKNQARSNVRQMDESIMYGLGSMAR